MAILIHKKGLELKSNRIDIPYFKEKTVISIMIVWQSCFALFMYDMSRDFQPPNPLIYPVIFIPMFIALWTLITIGSTHASKTE